MVRSRSRFTRVVWKGVISLHFYSNGGTLDNLVIEHVESVRQINRKKDVVFIVKLSAITLDQSLEVINNVYAGQLKTPFIKFPAFDDAEIPYNKRMSLVVAHTGSMEYKLYGSGEIKVTIPASDWIKDC